MKIRLAMTVATILAGGTLLSANEVTKLEDITVNESYSNSASSSYTTKESYSATKLDLSLKETPQSISVITQKQIEEQNLEDIGDILLQTPGISYIQVGNKTAGNASWYSRGMKIENYQRDGVPTSKYSFGNGEFIGLESTDIYMKELKL